jgi:MoxR-like ATPase
MVLEGPPGTAKTSFARIAAEILFGLGKIQRPDVMEVTEEDLVVGYVSQTAQRMKEVCVGLTPFGGHTVRRLVPSE